jgi:aspartyl/asparaginyl beta-hydroxylase (cupin superfamily)
MYIPFPFYYHEGRGGADVARINDAGLLSTLSSIRSTKKNNNDRRRSNNFQPLFLAAKGFGGGGGGDSNNNNKKSSNANKKSTSRTTTKGSVGNRLINSLEDKPKQKSASAAVGKAVNRPYVRSEQEGLLEALAAKSSSTCIGKAVTDAQKELSMIDSSQNSIDPFWELMPSIIQSRFPTVTDSQLGRIAGVVKHAILSSTSQLLGQTLLDQSIIDDPWRPHNEIHAYMPNLGPSQPFWDAQQLSITKQLMDNYETIKDEYHALIADNDNKKKDRFQSVTSMNYDSGWKTLVLFYNGKRIPDFPYHLCPKTTELLETLPLAGRIAGFNRQAPKSGIPLHSDGNNMWLTLQMGIQVPEGEDRAWIRVGPETQYWKNGQCICYDTTYEHETYNDHETQERVVLHIDFFNTLRLTPIEIEVMRYIYSLREEFMKAEGVAKVGKRIL